MVITYHGLECFKVQFGDTVLAFNPPTKKSKHQSVRFGADVVLASMNHEDFNGTDTIPAKDDNVFVIDGPGEYEVKGVFVKGYRSYSMYDGAQRLNTIYFVRLEKMTLCFLGGLNDKDLSQEIINALDEVDILFIPIGGDGVLTAGEASKLAVKIAPKVYIPMHYKDEKDPALKAFIKDVGDEDTKPVDKLTVKAKDMKEYEGELVVLSSVS